MKKPRKNVPPAIPSPVFFAVFIAAIVITLIALLIALIDSVDRADELFNSVRYRDDWRKADYIYQNQWQPFKNLNFIECIQSIPLNFYIGAVYFPSSLLVGIIFFPLLVFIIPFYEGFYLNEYTMLLMGWVPFLGGIALFVLAGLLAEMNKANKKMLADSQDDAPND